MVGCWASDSHDSTLTITIIQTTAFRANFFEIKTDNLKLLLK